MVDMGKTTELFDKLIAAWTELKVSKLKHTDGQITKDELFDVEYYAFEAESTFIKHLKKIK